ncbi:MAG TPA: YbaB/EbfC family nucleoid-associated protein [Phycisphaeraceae bacterium]
MLDQFKNLKNLAGMFGNAKELREKFEQLQAELAQRTVEADAGAGAVRVTANGKLQIVRVELDRPLIISLAGEGSQADQEMIEELIASAANAALEKAQEMVRTEYARLVGGMGLPGLEGLMGG